MRVKKYIGDTAYEAMNKLRSELGPDAIILNTRTIKQKGFFGFLKKPMVEITAAFEEKDLISRRTPVDNNWSKFNNEIQDLKNMIEEFSTSKVENTNEFPKELEKYKMQLISKGVEYSTATLIIRELNDQININNKDEEMIKNIVKYRLMEYIGDVKPLSVNLGYQKVVFFVGPTGVGKTTTLAKIAAQLVLEEKYNIGLITADTYRIAAVEQLKIYSDILNLPLKIIYDEEDIYKSLNYFKDKDIVLVDTAGRNHREIDKEDTMYKIINSINNKEVYLVLSGATDYITLKSIIEHYNIMDDYKIIFTKMDEAQGFGNILNAKLLTKNSLSYITTGQNVPDDIEILDKNKVVSCLIEENTYERSS